MTLSSSTAQNIDWRDFRACMPVTSKWAYFDHAAVAPLPQPAAEAVAVWCKQAAEEGDTVWLQWSRRISQVRQRAADLIGADPEETALVPSTTAGISLVAEGYPWQSGDNVVTLANEFPSNQYPWMNLRDRGVETRRVPVASNGEVDIQRIIDACDQRTRIVSLSWVSFSTGWRIDLDTMAKAVHEAGALFFVDAIQGLGVFPLDLHRTPIDFLAADGHKWMLGPEGAGIFYVRRPHLDLLRPIGVGWNSVVQGADFSHVELNIRPEAARYEGGTQNMAGFLALGASLDLLAQFGLSARSSAMADRVLQITDYACQCLSSVGAEIVSCRHVDRRSGIVAFRLPNQDHETARRRCLSRGVALSHRGGYLRISPHGYVNEEDVQRLVEAIEH